MRGSRDCRVAGGSCPTSGWSRTGWRSTCTRFRATSSTATRTPPGTRAGSSSRRSLKDDRNHDENELKLGRGRAGTLRPHKCIFRLSCTLWFSYEWIDGAFGAPTQNSKREYSSSLCWSYFAKHRSVGRLYVILQIYFLTTQVFFHDCHLRCLAEYVYWPFAHALVVEWEREREREREGKRLRYFYGRVGLIPLGMSLCKLLTWQDPIGRSFERRQNRSKKWGKNFSLSEICHGFQISTAATTMTTTEAAAATTTTTTTEEAAATTTRQLLLGQVLLERRGLHKWRVHILWKERRNPRDFTSNKNLSLSR